MTGRVKKHHMLSVKSFENNSRKWFDNTLKYPDTFITCIGRSLQAYKLTAPHHFFASSTASKPCSMKALVTLLFFVFALVHGFPGNFFMQTFSLWWIHIAVYRYFIMPFTPFKRSWTIGLVTVDVSASPPHSILECDAVLDGCFSICSVRCKPVLRSKFFGLDAFCWPGLQFLWNIIADGKNCTKASHFTIANIAF